MGEHDVTILLRKISDGDQDALGHLIPLVYDEIRGIANRHMSRERRDHTLQPTALINEAYRVLSDPGRRAMYDAERRGAPRPAAAGPTSEPSYDEAPAYTFQHSEGPARIPWRGLLFFSGVAIVAILVLAQFSRPSGPPALDNILRTGECVELRANGAIEVFCTGSSDLVVRQVTPRQGVCPDGSVSVPDRQGMVGVCLEQMPVDRTLEN